MKRYFKFMMMAMALVSMMGVATACGSDDNDDEPQAGIEDQNAFTDAKIINTWVLTKDLVEQSDGSISTITYSGGAHLPYYTYNKVIKNGEEGELKWEVWEYPASQTGAMRLTKTLNYVIDGKKIYNQNGDLAGTVTGWDPTHKSNNLQITWEAGMSPKGWAGKCTSQYLNGDWVRL